MTALTEREYVDILRERVPHAIRTKTAYGKALREVKELTILGRERTRGQTEYYRLLCSLVADYERSVEADKWPVLPPLDMLRELMDLKGVTQALLAHALGDRAAASAILSGRRSISKSQARKLAALFRVDAGVFI